MLQDAQERQQLPRSRQLDSPAGRVKIANLQRLALEEGICRLIREDRDKADVVRTYLGEALDPAVQYVARELGQRLEATDETYAPASNTHTPPPGRSATS